MASNKRVTQLVEITAPEVQLGDYLLIIDVSAKESKKIRASEVAAFLGGSGSLNAIHADNADTASYVLASSIAGIIVSASFAFKSLTSDSASWASSSISASHSFTSDTASFALNAAAGNNSASFLIYSGGDNGTASFAISSSRAQASDATLFLVYTGGNNGTASYAIKTQNVDHSTNSDTASFLIDAGTISTASYSLNSSQSLMSDSTNFLNFSENNGTASYAMKAKTFADIIQDYGIFLANTQSSQISQLDNITVSASNGSQSRTPIEVMATLRVPFTSSIPTNGLVNLVAKDRNTGFEIELDSSPVTLNISPTVGVWDGYNSGTLDLPVSLMGQTLLYGSYEVFMTASSNIQIQLSRTGRFTVSSESDTLSVNVDEPLQFNLTPRDTPILTFTSTDGGPFTDTLPGFLTSGSSNIFTLEIVSQSLDSVRYLWMLTSLTSSNVSNNPLSFLSGIPNSLTFLSCSNCSLTSLYTFVSSSLEVLNCRDNFLNRLPDLPTTVTYLDCSSNVITQLPATLPSSLIVFLAFSNSLQSLPTTLPNSIETMSLAYNSNLNSFGVTTLPTSLTNLSLNSSPVVFLPTIPSNILELFASSCSLDPLTIQSMTDQMVTNGVLSGTLDISGNGPPNGPSLTNIAQLESNGWFVLYDI